MIDTAKQQAMRKDDHILHALSQYHVQSSDEFLQTQFVRQSFSGIALDNVSLQTNVGEWQLQAPFFINAMTGGSRKAEQVNKDLAIVARETGLAMATGSVSVALKDKQAEKSFSIIRQMNPKGIVFANLGAHHSVENAKKAVELLLADAIQIHVNTAQELIMPEGERDFTGWLKNIEEMVRVLNVPVIVKEVGFGMARETIEMLFNIGVRMIDISGKGGTNFVQIENQRRLDLSYGIFNT